jgi:hypothetical protein
VIGRYFDLKRRKYQEAGESGMMKSMKTFMICAPCHIVV